MWGFGNLAISVNEKHFWPCHVVIEKSAEIIKEVVVSCQKNVFPIKKGRKTENDA